MGLETDTVEAVPAGWLAGFVREICPGMYGDNHEFNDLQVKYQPFHYFSKPRQIAVD